MNEWINAYIYRALLDIIGSYWAEIFITSFTSFAKGHSWWSAGPRPWVRHPHHWTGNKNLQVSYENGHCLRVSKTSDMDLVLSEGGSFFHDWMTKRKHDKTEIWLQVTSDRMAKRMPQQSFSTATNKPWQQSVTVKELLAAALWIL